MSPEATPLSFEAMNGTKKALQESSPTTVNGRSLPGDNSTPTSRHSVNQTPHLRKSGNVSQLIVNGKPFLMLAGELHNSSLSSAKYMSTVWPTLKYMNLNTVLGSVSWEQIEPTEGMFDFTELDACILAARKHGLHLVLLWFGSFKNAMSTYVPDWVKKDANRFPRVHVLDDNNEQSLKTIELLSPFSEAACMADQKAFAALMKHLKEYDQQFNTVLMVQVENEPGLLGDSRDRSRIAEQRFKQPVPQDLLNYLDQEMGDLHPKFLERWPDFKKRLKTGKSRDWEDVFGCSEATEELFMADAFSRYIGRVAAAGKLQYDIPFYTNCWLNFDDLSQLDLTGIVLGESMPTVAGGGAKAGLYPSGGPVPHALDVWNYNTIVKGGLDFIAPDIYLHDYEWAMQQYQYPGRPLFIPEQKADLAGARRVWLAYGTYGCIGCSPFGIDTVHLDQNELETWRRMYGLLDSMSRIILQVQAERPQDIFGFFFDEVDNNRRGQKSRWIKTFPDVDMQVTVERSFVFGRPSSGYGLVIHQGEGRFLLVGAGFQTTFKSTKPESTFTGILSSVEKEVDCHGDLKSLRIMNGDETRSGSFMIMPCDLPDYGGFPIRVTIPARTYISEVVVYTLEETAEDL